MMQNPPKTLIFSKMSPINLTFRSLPKPKPQSQSHHQDLSRSRTFVDTTIKWVRDRGLDHAVEREKNLRSLINIKNFIKSEPSKSLPISIISQNRQSLMIPTRPIEFIRKYPSIFEEFLPGGVAISPHVRLTSQVLDLDAEEQLMYQSETYKQQVADRLLKLLMLVRTNKLPLSIIERLKWDLGLPQDYEKSIVPEYPDCFKIAVGKDSASGSEDLRDLELVCWSNELAISVLERKAMSGNSGYVKGMPIAFPMQFSRGFEMDKKLKKWIDEWQKLPYVSPYENAAHLSSQSDESDKWAVAVLHELLHILVPKKTERENILCLGEYLGLRSRFKRALLHHPGILYLSNKIGTYTVVLKEGYKRGLISENHPLMDMRSRYIHLMNTVKEDSKMISVPGGVTQEKKDGVSDSKGKGEEEEDNESEEELEGELYDSSDAEVEFDDVDGDSDSDCDEEDEDESKTSIQKNAANSRRRRGRKSDFDVMTNSKNAEKGRSGGRRARISDFDVKASSRNSVRGRSGGQHPGKSRDDVSPKTSRRAQTDVRHNVRQGSRERSNLSKSKGRPLPDKKTSIY